MIRYAKEKEKGELKRLFNVCFPGEEDFCDYFFENCFKAEITLIDVAEGELRGAAMELPYYIRGIGEVTYLYSVATFPQFRGRGVSRGIIEKSRENDRKRGRKASVLIPGEKSLFEFYKKLGYKPAAFINERKFTAGYKNYGCEVRDCGAAELEKLYNESLSGQRYVVRSREYFERQLHMFKGFGGGCKGLYRGGKLVSYGFYSIVGEEILFDEIMGEEKEILAGEILKEFGFKEGTGREPGRGRALGMAYFYDEDCAFYMNLMFN